MSLRWSPPVELSKREESILRGCKKARLFVFLRRHRHALFDEAFQAELAAMYPARARGKEPVAPALLAMVTLLQAALGFSDEDAVEYAMFELRWQMLLDCLGDARAPFAQGTLFAFRQRLIAHDLDRRLLERTVELAHQTQGFSATALRAGFDASPLFGAGRVEDTFNLIGHAARDLLRSVASRLGTTVDDAARRAGIPALTGTSIKAALDIDWDDPVAKRGALERLLDQVRALEAFVARELAEAATQPPLAAQLATLRQFIGQDTEPDPAGGPTRITHGVAQDRRISVRDGEMRHGRKSKAVRVDGYKRHVARDLASKVIVAVAITPANRPEAEATTACWPTSHASRASSPSCRSIAAISRRPPSRCCTRPAWRSAPSRFRCATATASPRRTSRSICRPRRSPVPRTRSPRSDWAQSPISRPRPARRVHRECGARARATVAAAWRSTSTRA